MENEHTSSQNTQAETHSPVFEDNKVEATIDSPGPNEYVRDDTSRKMMSVNGRSTVPVQGHERPCQWASKNSNVSEDRWARVARQLRRIAEVCHCQLEEVDDDQQQGPPEV